AAERSAHLASNEDIAITSGRHVGFAVGHSLFASVSNAFTLFVHKAGMALVAASGKVRIEAQTDGIDLKAKQSVTVTSTTDSIQLHAAKEIVLHAGNTQVRISDQGYTVHTAGEHTIHAGSHQTDGPKGQGGGFPPFPKSGPGQLEVLRHYVTDSPVGKSAFTVTDSLGAKHTGTLDASGRAIVSGLAAGAVSVKHERDPNDPWVIGSYLKPPAWEPTDAAAPGAA
ncbi:type VI secretion system tip protein VgrG, partial [Burkholderia reimsis]